MTREPLNMKIVYFEHYLIPTRKMLVKGDTYTMPEELKYWDRKGQFETDNPITQILEEKKIMEVSEELLTDLLGKITPEASLCRGRNMDYLGDDKHLLEHEDGHIRIDCWCEPELRHLDGDNYLLHKDKDGNTIESEVKN